MRMRTLIALAITAAASSALAQQPVEVTPPPEGPPPAVVVQTTKEWAFGLAPSIGLTVPTSDLGAFVVGGLELDFALPVANRRLVLALDASLTRPTTSGSGNDTRVGGDYTYDLAVTEFKIGLDLIFRFFDQTHRLVPYIGVGPILHLLKSTESSDLAPGDNTAQDTKVGVEVLAGLDYRLGPGLLLGEVRYVYSSLDHKWTGSSNAGNVTISIGYRFVF